MTYEETGMIYKRAGMTKIGSMRLLPLLSLGQACFAPRNDKLLDSRFHGNDSVGADRKKLC